MIFLYKCIGQQGQKHVTLYPGMLPRVFGLEIAYVASPYHPEALKKYLRYYFYGTLNVSSDVATILSPFQSFLAKCASQITPVTALWSRLMTSTVENGRNNILLSFTVIKSSLNAELTLKNIDFCDFQLK